MGCDCSRLAYGAALLRGLECKTILGPFDRAFVLTDVVFDLDSHPNGANSRGGGWVWNVLPNKWSRKLLGAQFDGRGRQYHLQSGILCPKRSFLTVCNAYFVAEPTADVSARVMGCYCGPPALDIDVIGDLPTEVLGDETTSPMSLDPIDPLAAGLGNVQPNLRGLLATGYEALGRGPVLISAADRERSLEPGSTVALRVNRRSWRWSHGGKRVRAEQGPDGMNLLVARRSADGLLMHWAAFQEKQH